MKLIRNMIVHLENKHVLCLYRDRCYCCPTVIFATLTVVVNIINVSRGPL